MWRGLGLTRRIPASPAPFDTKIRLRGINCAGGVDFRPHPSCGRPTRVLGDLGPEFGRFLPGPLRVPKRAGPPGDALCLLNPHICIRFGHCCVSATSEPAGAASPMFAWLSLVRTLVSFAWRAVTDQVASLSHGGPELDKNRDGGDSHLGVAPRRQHQTPTFVSGGGGGGARSPLTPGCVLVLSNTAQILATLAGFHQIRGAFDQIFRPDFGHHWAFRDQIWSDIGPSCAKSINSGAAASAKFRPGSLDLAWV